MADYQPLIARAVDGLGTSTGEARRALYERARAALVSQLRSIEPALTEADITRERLALEDAIRKVEAESVRKARGERPAPLRSAPATARMPAQPAAPVPPRRDRPAAAFGTMPPAPRAETARAAPPRGGPPPLRMPSGPAPDEAPQPAAAGSARSRLLNARTSPIAREGLKGFREVVNEVDDLGAASARSAQSARDTRNSYGAAAARQLTDDDEPPHSSAPSRGSAPMKPTFSTTLRRPCARSSPASISTTSRRHSSASSRSAAANRRTITRNRVRRAPIAALPGSPWC